MFISLMARNRGDDLWRYYVFNAFLLYVPAIIPALILGHSKALNVTIYLEPFQLIIILKICLSAYKFLEVGKKDF